LCSPISDHGENGKTISYKNVSSLRSLVMKIMVLKGVRPPKE